ncbi:MAG: 50S ribosomal protein L15 [Candidatus Sericytochromatia bacterium]|nr:50S ribosomal protein L15 [Candidatus Tanganyikabacteria bacterium]
MTFEVADLRPADGATKKPKRVGRGFGSGHGKTATRGYNGQGQRSGESKKIGFEGGQMPLFRRTPKKHHFQRPLRYLDHWAEINVGALNELFSGDNPITADLVAERGFAPGTKFVTEDGNVATVLKPKFTGLRVLGAGEVTKTLEVHAHHFTKAAREKIEAAGGKCVVIGAEEAEG